MNVEVYKFIEWLVNQKKVYMGNKLFYDVIGYYKFLEEKDMFDYWLKYIS